MRKPFTTLQPRSGFVKQPSIDSLHLFSHLRDRSHHTDPQQSKTGRSLAQESERQRQMSIHAAATHIEELAASHAHEIESRPHPQALICTPTSADTCNGVIEEIQEAKEAGADVIELRLDYLKDLNAEAPEEGLKKLIDTSKAVGLPAIVTLRPVWEGGKFDGHEAQRLALLKFASTLEPAYVDVELLAADFFFAGAGTVPIGTNVILSHHDYEQTPTDEQLDALVAKMYDSGADIAKLAVKANDLSDSIRMLHLAQRTEGPMISLAMGEKGLPSRLLASKFGSHLTFASLGNGRASAPGQPTISDLREMYRADQLTPQTQIFGVVGHPVMHSRSPALHNAAFRASGLDAIYMPLLVDSFPDFLKSFKTLNIAGLSVTIPHKEEALKAADEVDKVAESIGAVNTLVRQPDGRLKAYNTDYSAAIEAIEERLAEHPLTDCGEDACAIDLWDDPIASDSAGPSGIETSPLEGLRVVIVGAGGSGKALAFGAASRGAHVIIANRTLERAEKLCRSLGDDAEAVSLDAVASGDVSGDVLINTTSVGMHPNVDQTPVPASALSSYHLVFDAIYVPLETQLLKAARGAGCLTVSGLEMFIGQAAQQFKLFTGKEAPLDVMRKAVLDSISTG